MATITSMQKATQFENLCYQEIYNAMEQLHAEQGLLEVFRQFYGSYTIQKHFEGRIANNVVIASDTLSVPLGAVYSNIFDAALDEAWEAFQANHEDEEEDIEHLMEKFDEATEF